MSIRTLLKGLERSKARRLVVTSEGLAALEAESTWPAVKSQLDANGVTVVVVPAAVGGEDGDAGA